MIIKYFVTLTLSQALFKFNKAQLAEMSFSLSFRRTTYFSFYIDQVQFFTFDCLIANQLLIHVYWLGHAFGPDIELGGEVLYLCYGKWIIRCVLFRHMADESCQHAK